MQIGNSPVRLHAVSRWMKWKRKKKLLLLHICFQSAGCVFLFEWSHCHITRSSFIFFLCLNTLKVNNNHHNGIKRLCQGFKVFVDLLSNHQEFLLEKRYRRWKEFLKKTNKTFKQLAWFSVSVIVWDWMWVTWGHLCLNATLVNNQFVHADAVTTTFPSTDEAAVSDYKVW